MGVGKSLRRLAEESGFSLDTIKRWVRRAGSRAPQIHPYVRKLCQEFDPALPVSAGNVESATGERNEMAQAIWWARKWGELTAGQARVEEIGGWAIVNVLEFVQAKRLWL